MYSVKNNEIVVYLRYVNNKPLFIKIKFVSTAGSRKYFTKEGITFFRKNVQNAQQKRNESCFREHNIFERWPR